MHSNASIKTLSVSQSVCCSALRSHLVGISNRAPLEKLNSATVPRIKKRHCRISFGIMLGLLIFFSEMLVDHVGAEAQKTTMASRPYANVSDAGTEPNMMDRPLWCPDGYVLKQLHSVWVHACLPKPCGVVRSSGTMEIPCPHTFAASFWDCPRYGSLSATEYDVLPDGSLYILTMGVAVPLGQFFIRGTNAVICDPNGTGKPEASPRWCATFRNPGNNTSWRLPQGSLPWSYHRTGDICIPMDPKQEVCQPKFTLGSKRFELQPNLDLVVNQSVKLVYPVGHYELAIDHSFAMVCLQEGYTPLAFLPAETRYFYGAATVLSAVALFLALLAHAFFPDLNDHTKGLLCLAFSLLVMYIIMAINHLADFAILPLPIVNFILFAVEYIFSLASFFWLGVIGFDLWKAFSKLKGTITASTGKRAFAARCAYAFGIPTIMCIIAVCLASSPRIQDKLGLFLVIHTLNWYTNNKTGIALFYGPILIVLVQNVLFFAATVVNIRRASSGTEMVNKAVGQKLLRVYLKLFLVMGITWLAEVIWWLTLPDTDQAAWYESPWHVFDLINCLQGFFIFLIYVCKRKTLNVIKNKLGYRRATAQQMCRTVPKNETKASLDNESLGTSA